MDQELKEKNNGYVKEEEDDDDEHHTSLRSQLANKKFHEKVDFILHRPVVEYVVIFLIVADAIIVTASIMLEVNLIQEKARMSIEDGKSQVTESPVHAENGSESTSNHDKVHQLEKALEALHFTSLSILVVFLIEVFLKLYGQREKFFKRKMQVIDSFIVAVSFALDIAVVVVQNVDSTIISGFGLMIILRLWRMVRIVNVLRAAEMDEVPGAIIATKTELQEKIHASKRDAKVAREEVEALQEQLNEKEAEIDFLKSRLSKYEPIDMIPTGSTRLPPYLPETKKFPKQVLGETTDDEDYQISGFTDLRRLSSTQQPAVLTRPNVGQEGTAFQAYQPGMTYQPTSQFPVDQMRSHSTAVYPRPTANFREPSPPARGTPAGNANYHDNELVDTADESDVVSIKPSKSRSGNTFTVKKDGVPMTSV